MHVGACVAPVATPQIGRAFWKLAALDLQLGMPEDPARQVFCATTPFMSQLLRPAVPPSVTPADAAAQSAGLPLHGASVLSLSFYDASLVDYLAAAHASPTHTLHLQRVYSLLDPKAATGGAAAAAPGLARWVSLFAAPGEPQMRHTYSVPAAGASVQQKLEALTVATSDTVAAHVGEVDIAVGALPCAFC